MKSYWVMIWLILGIVTVSGCGKENICIQKPVPKIECNTPERPALLVMGKEYDRKIIFKNINTLIEYSETLEAAVECYETGLSDKK